MLPEEEQTFLHTKKDLLEWITGLLGGRVAEEIIFGGGGLIQDESSI